MNRPILFQVLPVVLGIVAAVYTPARAQSDDSSAGAGAGAGAGQRMPFARRHGGGGAGHGIGREFENVRGILTDDQKPQFEQIIAKSMEEGKPLRQQLIQLQQTSGDNPDAKTQSKIDDLKAQMREHHKQTREKVMALLSPQQKSQLAGLKGQGKGQRSGGGAAPAASTPAGASQGDDGAMDGDK
jgi:Spy/CpxP family protein refolding chaperone